MAESLVVVLSAGAVIVGPLKGVQILDWIVSADTNEGASKAAAMPALTPRFFLLTRHTFLAYENYGGYESYKHTCGDNPHWRVSDKYVPGW